MILNKIFGNKIEFYELLQSQADYLIESIETLKQYVETLNSKYAGEVKRIEKEADLKRREVVLGLNKTFITPFDREDIFMLSKLLDDILDYFKSTVNELEIYQIKTTPELVKFIDQLELGSTYIHDAVYSMKKDRSTAVQLSVKAKKCENEVEKLYRQSIADLLAGEDIKYILKTRELYRHLSNCADRIDQTADLICHILMKEVV